MLLSCIMPFCFLIQPPVKKQEREDLGTLVGSQLPLNPNEIQFLLPKIPTQPSSTAIINLLQITFLECINTEIHKIILVDYILHEIMRVFVFPLHYHV